MRKYTEEVQLADQIAIHTNRILNKYNNHLSHDHQRGVLVLADTYADFLISGRSGRIAVPLPTGTGKTSTIIGLIQALEELGLERSMLVCAEKVEALCELKRTLVEYGVREGKIGLLHSFQHDPNFNRESPNPGTASEPSNTDVEADGCPYLLATHQRIKRQKGEGIHLPYKGKKRDLTIWDESLITSEGWSIKLASLKYEIGGWMLTYEGYLEAGKVLSNNAKELQSFVLTLNNGIDFIFDELETGDSRLIRFGRPDLTEHEIQAAILEVVGDVRKAEHLKRILVQPDELLRAIRTSGNDAFLRYEVVIPDEYDKVVVLDASYPIREIGKLDDTIEMEDVGFQKDYSSVQINHFQSRSSRYFVEGEFSKGLDNALASEVSQIVSDIQEKHPDEGVLLFTFKARKIDVVEKLKSVFKENGVDIEGVDDKGQKLVNFLTWGMETSLNSYSHCKHVIFVGVLHLPPQEVAAKVVGQKRDLEAVFQKGDIERIHLHEQAHMIYQALSRGSCRHTVEGKAEPMQAYLFHSKIPDLREILKGVMPGVRWVPYEPKYLPRGVSKAVELAHDIHVILEETGIPKVSSRAVKKMLDEKYGKTINSSMFRKAGDKVSDFGYWIRDQRSFITMFDDTSTSH
ncbi:MAG: DEAD/DEAH box helicase family protein [Sedimenticola sp.]